MRCVKSLSGRILSFSALAIFLALTGVGCNDEEPVQCNSVAADQKGSFMARVRAFPLAVTMDDSFSAAQKSAISLAVAQWNLVAQQTIGQDMFSLSEARFSASTKSVDPRQCQDAFGTERSFSIVNEQSADHWTTLGFNSRIPGATFRCEQNGITTRQIIFLYPDVVAPSQIASVTIHELGHSIGLDHSCLDSGDRTDFRSCSGLDVNHPYHLAVMYPWLRTKTVSTELPEIKDDLRANDKARGKCALGVP